jgi:hypothetical protein
MSIDQRPLFIVKRGRFKQHIIIQDLLKIRTRNISNRDQSAPTKIDKTDIIL